MAASGNRQDIAMTMLRQWIRTHPALAIAAAVAQLAILAVAGIGVARATDSPTFCVSACHEMGPFHSAWQAGPHSEVECVSCHVDPGTVARLEHKVVAMSELWTHVSGDPTFPLEDPSPVPDERCISCHEKIEVTATGFDHDAHAGRGACQSCHSTAGHEVDAIALKQAGIFNPEAQKQILSATVAVVDGGSANIAGHVLETCSNCHDMQKTGCSSCHEPDHEGKGTAAKTAECTTCHSPGTEFAFAHPAENPDCASCHATPAAHEYKGECTQCHEEAGVKWAFSHGEEADCSNCHARPEGHRNGTCATCHDSGATWAFKHPGTDSSCTTCHKTPSGHRAGACTSCHAAGTSWAFKHPGSGSTCTSCHTKPGGHRAGACSRCHTAGKSWAFRHPGSGATCTSCHNRPSSHSSRSCTTCHRVGSSWSFRHPSSGTCSNCHNRPSGHKSGTCSSCHSTGSWAFRHSSSSSCSSCHSAPSNHYGSSCSSCHSPSRSWSSATFSHPRIPGGEHTYRSFACSNCHTSGYSSYSCTRCHDSNNPDSEPGDD